MLRKKHRILGSNPWSVSIPVPRIIYCFFGGPPNMIHCYELFRGRANKNSSYFREGRVVGFRKRQFWNYPGYLFGRFPLLGHLAFCYFDGAHGGWFRHMSGRWSIGDDLWISSWAHQQRFHLSWYQATKVPSGLKVAATDIDMFGF